MQVAYLMECHNIDHIMHFAAQSHVDASVSHTLSPLSLQRPLCFPHSCIV